MPYNRAMNYQLLLSILFDLLRSRRLTATELAEKYAVSTRTVHRYIRRLSTALPLFIKRGKGGGIYLADCYRLPVDALTTAEYDAAIEALSSAYAQSSDERYLSARRKLTATQKEQVRATATLSCGDFRLLSTAENEELISTVRTAAEGVREKRTLLVRFEGRDGVVEPHLLLSYDNAWYLYGFCHRRRSFYPFPLEKVEGVWLTKEKFRPRAYSLTNISLK